MKFKVDIIESERGWGSKVDSTIEFNSLEEAQKYVKNYNTKYNNAPEVPDWYMMAELRHPIPDHGRCNFCRALTVTEEGDCAICGLSKPSGGRGQWGDTKR